MNPAFRTLLAFVFCFSLTSSVKAAPRQLLTGHVPAAVVAAQPVGRVPLDKKLDLAIGLPLRNREALTNLLERLYDPSSPDFHHYLTPAQFAGQFGPTTEDYDAVKAFAASNGLTVTRTYSNRMLVDVRGTAAAINRALHVTLQEYQHPTEGRTYFAPNTEPSLDLAIPILHVAGLDNYAMPRPLMNFSPFDPKAPRAIGQDGSGPNGFYAGRDFREAYAPDVTLDGAGQSVALLEFDGYFPQDIIAYETLANLPRVPLTNIFIGVSGVPGRQTVEVSLDIEMAASMATNLASIMVYEGDSGDDILNQMAVDDIAQQMSCSWTFSIDSTTIQIYQQFIAQGQSMFQASGDSDAYPGKPAPPTDVPYLTSVGGTTLATAAGGGAYSSEVVWNRGGGVGSSGGISATYAIPSWQKGIDMSQNQGSTTFRNVPDVCMIAEDVFEIGNNGVQGSVGGTSCSAPLWAAFTALANELAASNGLPSVGFLNPAVYALAKGSSYSATLHDIQIGNNESTSSPNRFSAAPGYDLCTGWGSPVGNSLVYAIGLPEALQVIPLSPTPFAGPVGGPFGPASFSVTLTNSRTTAFNWTLSNTSPWLSLSPASGRVNASGTETLTATVKPAATNYAPGTYTATVWFTNTLDSFPQKRVFTLLVALPPSITSQPTNESLVDGQTASFTVGTSATSQLAYQWWEDNGTNTFALADSSRVSGVDGATLRIANVTESDAASYFVVVSNVAGVATSSNAVLSLVPSAPVVAVPPSDDIALPGDVARFSVTAVGTRPLTYQWKFHGTNLFTQAGVSGATSSSLTVSNISAGWAGAFTVIIANALGTNSASANLTVLPVTAPGAALNAIYSFTGGTGGQNPYGGLMTNKNLPTVFYGTTLQGGTDGFGEVYRMTTNGAVTPIIAFTSANGANPYASLALGSDNFLYGVSAAGGAANDGTVFRVSTSGQLTTLASLTGVSGQLPVAAMFQARDGNYYGTSIEGGLFANGNLFRVTPGGVLSNLVSFDQINGAFPSGALIQDTSSNLFGTTENGGFYGLGAIFQLTPSGQVINWVSFDGSDGNSPVSGLTFDALGNMYGTTFLGGLYDDGEVFEISPDGSGVVLYDFSGDDGENPFGGLVLGADGNLYGTTENGGAFNSGTIFEISPDGVLQTLASFDGFQGAQPTSALLPFKGAWYGTAANGGANGFGSAYRLTVSGPLQITGQPVDYLVDIGGTALFQVSTFGGGPVTYQCLRNGTNLVNGAGVTGANSRVLAISNAAPASAGVYSVIVNNSFGAVTSSPALLQVLISTPVITQQPLDQTVLDGATAMFTVQAIGDYPLAYQWLCNGQPLTNSSRIQGATNTSLIIRHATNSDSGNYSVIVYDDLFDTQSSNAALLVTPLVGQGYSLQTLHTFGAGFDGTTPFASLVQARNGFLYGTALNGGVVGAGTIFRVNTNGSVTSIYAFSGGDDGAGPFAGLVQGQGTDANLYGVASSGGANAVGTLFKLAPNNTVSTLYAFTGGDDGSGPEGTLVFGRDGNLYGTASTGGSYNAGSIFVSDTSGNLSSIYSFTGADDGAFPLSGLTLGSDGNFYGTTYQGGIFDYGTVFQVDTNGNLTTLYSFSGNDGAFPAASVTEGLDGRFYGTAFEGGAGQFGVVFAVSTNGDFTNLFSFDYNDGALIGAGLTPARNGAFFGAVQNGGPAGAGGIYKITPDGVWSPVIWFDGDNGGFPQSAPTLATDGFYYGVTYDGGTNNEGVAYRFGLPALPTILDQPTNLYVPLGASAVFTVTATSASPLSYQWLFDGAAISGATNSTYTLSDVTNGNAGSYTVLLSNAGGTLASDDALLIVISPPLIDNGGFELGSFSGWLVSGATNELSIQTNAAAVHSGSFGALEGPGGSMAFLGQSVATTPGDSYSLSFWLDGTNNSAADEIRTSWNGAVISDLTIDGTLGWTNLQFVVVATNTVSSFSIGLQAGASSISLDDVALTPIPSLQSTDISQSPGEPPQITLHWNVTLGQEYQVQCKDALGSGSWSNLGPVIVTGSGVLTLADYLTNSQRFYRLVLLP
jgi:uncharacterized repeat protein (TIGR03803 family)